MCYTSGTTGRPKGVLYSHRAIAIHALTAGSLLGVNEGDAVLPVVPMFHANAWCFPFSRTLVGVKQVFPGPHLDPESLLDAFQPRGSPSQPGCRRSGWGSSRRSTRTRAAGTSRRCGTMTVGGAAPPRAMIEAFGERHGLHVTHGWGMTEMCPIGTISGPAGTGDRPAPARVRQACAAGPADPVRRDPRQRRGGPRPLGRRRRWASSRCAALDRVRLLRGARGARPLDRDGWFRTGDIVTIDPDGFVEVQDRAKDLVKSGGEWISTVALENALMGHPAVAEAAVIAVPDEKWSERPLAVVVLREGEQATPTSPASSSRRASRSGGCRTASNSSARSRRPSVGKFRKSALRDQFASAARPRNLGAPRWPGSSRPSGARRSQSSPIDNPPMNALSTALLEELEAELDALDEDDGVRAISCSRSSRKQRPTSTPIRPPCHRFHARLRLHSECP